MKKHRKNTYVGGRALIVAAVLALCAALIPSQASAAPLTKKVNFRTAAAVSSCTFTVEKVDLTANTVTWKVVANARPAGFGGTFNNKNTLVVCTINFNNATPVTVNFYVSGATVNKTQRTTVAHSAMPFLNSYCGASSVVRRDGSVVSSAAFTCIPG